MVVGNQSELASLLGAEPENGITEQAPLRIVQAAEIVFQRMGKSPVFDLLDCNIDGYVPFYSIKMAGLGEFSSLQLIGEQIPL